MKTVGIFEAKTKLSEICEEVARTRVPVVVTRRGTALVCIEPVPAQKPSIGARRAAYLAAHGDEEPDDATDFEPVARSREKLTFRFKD